jgi:hypothetical protein
VTNALGSVGAVWGVGGLISVLVYAITRISTRSVVVLSSDLGWHHWTVLLGCAAFMAYSEGYRGFHRSFSPRVIARARYLSTHPQPLRLLLAPLFCAGYFHATRQRLTVTYLLTAMITTLVFIVRQLPQPWRGLVGLSVVVGLTWGTLSIVVLAIESLRGRQPDATADVPASPA